MADAKFCTNCGAPLNGAKFCPNCGQSAEIKPETKFCKFCGEVIPGDAVVARTAADRSRTLNRLHRMLLSIT